ncbi:hypothetical protein QWY82_07665 [Simiduia curdlanivorans]|uniref:CopL family metal-binding regulatory protein n=1 Tax=Simiduia curdlanivorans TaxID=1492769 RepID=A0ABV8V7V3_9GAMM|nr:hypothetical protein [Simiduia curdlanivorans]MDN3638680.1 hypothetical protein [Simiduia curdlanivorans]
MTLRARQLAVLTLLLTFSVQLLASAVPPCAMLSSGADALVTPPDDARPMQQVAGHEGMNHADMGHGEATRNDRAGSAAMACCESEQGCATDSCDMDSCIMAPAVPSLMYTPVDVALNTKPATAVQFAFAHFLEPRFHPPRSA